MATRPASWFRMVALVAALAAVLAIPALEWLLHGVRLSPWLHIPLTVIALGSIGGGAMVAGAAYLEFQSRSAGSGQKA